MISLLMGRKGRIGLQFQTFGIQSQRLTEALTDLSPGLIIQPGDGPYSGFSPKGRVVAIPTGLVSFGFRVLCFECSVPSNGCETLFP